MNVPPKCEFVDLRNLDGSPKKVCWKHAPWVVIDKTTGKIEHRCWKHEGCKIAGHTYSVFPAKDYTKPRSTSAGPCPVGETGPTGPDDFGF